MNPNSVFKQKNNPIKHPDVDLSYNYDTDFHMTCLNCGFNITIHLPANVLFRPSFVTCPQCNKPNWDWDLEEV